MATYWLFVAPLAALILLLFVAPVAQILWLSVSFPEIGLQNYAELWNNPNLRQVLATTFWVCAVTTLFAVLIGYVIAYAMAHAGPTERSLMLTLVLISFWISVLVRAFAWLRLLRRNGVANTFMIDQGWIEAPLELVRNDIGVYIGMVHYMIPYAILPILAVMRGVDTRLLDASRSLGAGAGRTFWRIYLPLTLPGVAAAILLVFVLSLGFYITPALLGGGKVQMIAEYVSVQFLNTSNVGLAAMMASTLLICVFALLALMARFMRLSTVFGGPS